MGMAILKFKVNLNILSPKKLQTIIGELQTIGEYNVQTGEFIYDDKNPEVLKRLNEILDTNLLNANGQ